MSETKNLVSVATFAKKKKVSTTAVYQWIAAGRVLVVEIDGKKFVNANSTTK